MRSSSTLVHLRSPGLRLSILNGTCQHLGLTRTGWSFSSGHGAGYVEGNNPNFSTTSFSMLMLILLPDIVALQLSSHSYLRLGISAPTEPLINMSKHLQALCRLMEKTGPTVSLNFPPISISIPG